MRTRYIVGGLLFGWLVIGTGAAAVLQIALHYLDVELQSPLDVLVTGLVIVVGIGVGGVLGTNRAEAARKPASPAAAAPRSAPAQVQTRAIEPPRPGGPAAEVHQMKQLLDLHAKGVLSLEEFNTARARLLNKH